MATLQKQIADKFLEKLAHEKDVDAAQLDELKTLSTSQVDWLVCDEQTIKARSVVEL